MLNNIDLNTDENNLHDNESIDLNIDNEHINYNQNNITNGINKNILMRITIMKKM